MSSLLIAMGFFMFGLLVGIMASAIFYTSQGAKMSKTAMDRLFAEQGYEIKDGKIMPIKEA